MYEPGSALGVGGFLLALVVMWIASPRTRKLATFGVFVTFVAGVLLGLLVLIRVLWFPDPPA